MGCLFAFVAELASGSFFCLLKGINGKKPVTYRPVGAALELTERKRYCFRYILKMRSFAFNYASQNDYRIGLHIFYKILSAEGKLKSAGDFLDNYIFFFNARGKNGFFRGILHGACNFFVPARNNNPYFFLF